VNPETERAQMKKLRAIKKQRDDAAVRAALKRLDAACRSDERPSGRDGENLLHPIMEAVKVYATLGEICGVMREAFGDYQPPTAV